MGIVTKVGRVLKVMQKCLQFIAHRKQPSIQPDGIRYDGYAKVIRLALRQVVLDGLRKGHLGVKKMRSLARQMY